MQVFQRPLRHLSLSLVREQFLSIPKGHPSGAGDFDSHFWSDVVDATGKVAHEIKADDFEDPFSARPTAGVDVLDIAEFGNHFRGDSGLLVNFPKRGFHWLLAFINQAFGQC